MDKTLRLWDVRAEKCAMSMQFNDYAEMNYVSLSENTKNYNVMKTSKRSSVFVSRMGGKFRDESSKLTDM